MTKFSGMNKNNMKGAVAKAAREAEEYDVEYSDSGTDLPLMKNGREGGHNMMGGGSGGGLGSLGSLVAILFGAVCMAFAGWKTCGYAGEQPTKEVRSLKQLEKWSLVKPKAEKAEPGRILTGSELLDGRWGKQRTLLFRSLLKDGQGKVPFQTYLNKDIRKMKFHRGPTTPQSAGKLFFSSFVRNIHDHVMLVEYPDHAEVPIPRRGNHHVGWFMSQVFSGYFLMSYLDHKFGHEAPTQSHSSQIEQSEDTIGFWVTYFARKTGLGNRESSRQKARMYLKQMFALAGGMVSVLRFRDSDYEWMRWRDDLADIAPDEASVLNENLKEASFPNFLDSVDKIVHYGTQNLVELQNMLGFFLLREVSRELQFGVEFFQTTAEFENFLDEFTRAVMIKHFYKNEVHDAMLMPVVPKSGSYGYDSNSPLYYLNTPTKIQNQLSSKSDKTSLWQFSSLIYAGHCIGHLRPTCAYDHFSSGYSSLSESIMRYGLFEALSGGMKSTKSAGHARNKRGEELEMTGPSLAEGETIKNGMASQVLFFANMMFEQKEFVTPPREGAFSEIKQMLEEPGNLAHLLGKKFGRRPQRSVHYRNSSARSRIIGKTLNLAGAAKLVYRPFIRPAGHEETRFGSKYFIEDFAKELTSWTYNVKVWRKSLDRMIRKSQMRRDEIEMKEAEIYSKIRLDFALLGMDSESDGASSALEPESSTSASSLTLFHVTPVPFRMLRELKQRGALRNLSTSLLPGALIYRPSIHKEISGLAFDSSLCDFLIGAPYDFWSNGGPKELKEHAILPRLEPLRIWRDAMTNEKKTDTDLRYGNSLWLAPLVNSIAARRPEDNKEGIIFINRKEVKARLEEVEDALKVGIWTLPEIEKTQPEEIRESLAHAIEILATFKNTDSYGEDVADEDILHVVADLARQSVKPWDEFIVDCPQESVRFVTPAPEGTADWKYAALEEKNTPIRKLQQHGRTHYEEGYGKQGGHNTMFCGSGGGLGLLRGLLAMLFGGLCVALVGWKVCGGQRNVQLEAEGSDETLALHDRPPSREYEDMLDGGARSAFLESTKSGDDITRY